MPLSFEVKFKHNYHTVEEVKIKNENYKNNAAHDHSEFDDLCDHELFR